MLQLLGTLMTVVQMQHNTLLPLLRVACQALTVEGLDLLQIKAAGEPCPALAGTLIAAAAPFWFAGKHPCSHACLPQEQDQMLFELYCISWPPIGAQALCHASAKFGCVVLCLAALDAFG